MKNKTPNENLLDAVLLDTPTHEASLHIVRRAARRRRWSRHLRHGALVTVAMATVVMLLLPNRGGKNQPQPLPIREPGYVIHSRALPAGLLVNTRENGAEVVRTFSASVQLLSTAHTVPPERINDETLLQLAPGAVLVQHQSGAAELVFPHSFDDAMESRVRNE